MVEEADVFHRNAQRVAERHQVADSLPFDGIAEENHQLRLSLQFVAERFHRGELFTLGGAQAASGILVFPHRARRHGVGAAAIMPPVGANLKRQQRVRLRQVTGDDKDRLAAVEVRRGCQRV